MEFLTHVLATWFCVGLVPALAGLFSILTLSVLYWLAKDRWAIWLAAIGSLVVLGTIAAHASGELTGVVDDGRIVIDEVAAFGVLLTLLRPVTARDVAVLGVAFAALDGLKPWPISLTEAWSGAWGVMGDDLALAFVMAAILVPIAFLRRRAALTDQQR